MSTIGITAPLVGVPAALIVLLVGGDDLLEKGGLIVTFIIFPVTALGVSWFRYQRGAAGFPRRRPIQPGDRVGDWHVLDRLESDVRRDGTYLVRRGEDFGVLKVSFHRSNDHAARRLAMREADYLDRVSSRHVVACLDSDQSATETYVVTRYLGQQTLWQRRRAGAVTDAEVYSIAAGTMRGLVALHHEGVTHRDLTPFNVMIDGQGAATIIDLGIARADATQLSTSRQGMFTVAYRAPEQFTGPATAKSDVFVWAATIYFLATGAAAFTGNEAEIQNRILTTTPDLNLCPQWLQPILQAAFARDPNQRPTADEVLHRLEATNPSGWPVRTATPATPARTKRWPTWFTPSAALIAMVLASLTIYLLIEKPSTAEPDQAGDPSSTTLDDRAGEPPDPTSSTEPDETTTSTSRATTTTSTPPASPVADFEGVWHGGSTGSDGTVPVVFTIDTPSATAEGDPVGEWTYFNCTGPLRLVTATSTELVLTPVETQPDCGYGGQATLTRTDDTAAYDWQSDDGTDTRNGTFTRSARITLDDPGWPTGSNEAGNAFYAYLGVCMTGGSGCSESGQTPDWTACTTSELCIGGGGAPVVDVWDDLTWQLEIPEAVPNTAVALLAVGFTEDQVLDLLDL